MGRIPPQRAREIVDDLCGRADDGDDLLARVDAALRKILNYDGAAWFGTDPGTLLATLPARIDGVEAGHCETFWHREFNVEDALLYRNLQRQSDPIGSLQRATDGRPIRSARYREYLEPQGYDDELRAVFKVGDSVWGIVGLYRQSGRPAFDDDDYDVVRAISGSIATALRTHSAGSAPWSAAPAAPGLLIFDADNSLISANEEAGLWLDAMDHGTTRVSPVAGTRSWVPAEPGRQRGADAIPSSLIALLARARAVQEGYENGQSRLRLRSRTGQWLIAHASCMSGSGDVAPNVAVVIEPAKSSDIAPVIVEAYALTARERDVVRAIARGLTSPEIAAELFLSPHTVRDHVKSVFEKVGVSSRGELVAKLFAEHYTEALHAGVVQPY